MTYFYFWQNMISMHQSAYMRALSEMPDVKVVLIVEEYIYSNRKEMGWNVPDLGAVEVKCFQEATPLDWRQIIDDSPVNSYHIFSGLGAFKKIHTAFKHAVKNKHKVGIMAEPLDDRGWKGIARLAIARMSRIRFEKKILFWLTIGEKAYYQYQSVGYPASKLFHWAYCVEELKKEQTNNRNSNDEKRIKIIYAGSLYSWKGYDLLVDALIEVKSIMYEADFYCINKNTNNLVVEGLKKKTKNSPVNFYTMMDNQTLREKIGEYDLLILPSRYDGWGAVVNEALDVGTPVLVSSNCGSSTLVKYNGGIGAICEAGNKEDLKEKLTLLLGRGRWSNENRVRLKQWAQKHIAGRVLSAYLLQITDSLERAETKPVAPWML